MIVKEIKDLEKIMKLCLKLGVTAIKVGNVEFGLPEHPKAIKAIAEDIFPEAQVKVPKFNGIAAKEVGPDKIDTDELTPEQLLNWSVTEEENS